MDMMSTYSSFTFESCQARFYTLTRNVLINRRQQNQQLTPEEEFFLNYVYIAFSFIHQNRHDHSQTFSHYRGPVLLNEQCLSR